jgi:hypothetical protein
MPRPGTLRIAGALVTAAVLSSSGSVAQTTAGQPLFSKPFVVEHSVTQRGADGSIHQGPNVTDYYAGSWIVSVQPDGNRTIVDFARREITNVHAGRGTYSVLGFDRLVELRARLRRAEGGEEASAVKAEGSRMATAAKPAAPSFEIAEVSSERQAAAASTRLAKRHLSPIERPGVLHFKVTPRVAADHAAAGGSKSSPGALEVWLDPTVRLGPAALAQLAIFETDILSNTPGKGQVAWSRGLVAARERGAGAFAIRTVRPLPTGSEATRAESFEDVATRLEPLDRLPADLLTIPEGYRRVAHPLETMVVFAEEEAARTRQAQQGSAH